MGAKPHPRLVRSICGGALGAALAMTPAAAGTTAAASRDVGNASSRHAMAEPLRPPPNPFGSSAAGRHGADVSGAGATGTGHLISHRCRAGSTASSRTTDHARTDPAQSGEQPGEQSAEQPADGTGEPTGSGGPTGAAADSGAAGHASAGRHPTVERRSAFGPRLWTRHGPVAVRAATDTPTDAEGEPETRAGRGACPHRGPVAHPGTRHDAKTGERSAPGEVRPAHPDARARAKKRSATRRHPSLRRLNRAPVSASYGMPGGWLAGHHTGVDFAMSVGTPVHSVARGTVVESGWSGSYGNRVLVLLDDGHYALYAHLERIDVEPGTEVAENTRIGLSGNTGRSTGPHLHFEIRAGEEYGSDIDPLSYLRERGAPRP